MAEQPPAPARRAVVLVNLGTPDSPALPDVQSYLRQFLSDKRIVDLPRAFWKPFLELFLLRRYAPKSAARYAGVWRPDGSPIMVYARQQVSALREQLPADVAVDFAMRYGQPSLATVFDRLRAGGVSEILLVPLFPQFSYATTLSIQDDWQAYLKARPSTAAEPLTVTMVERYGDDAGYIAACAGRITAFWEEHGRLDFTAGDKLLLSFHGVPVSLVKAGDPYADECRQTAELLRQHLGLTPEQCLMTYQSKFGRGEWLTPATIETVRQLGANGVKRLDVFCPGFAADCLETLEEIGQLNRDAFIEAGGQELNRIDALNATPQWIKALAGIIRSHWNIAR